MEGETGDHTRMAKLVEKRKNREGKNLTKTIHNPMNNLLEV